MTTWRYVVHLITPAIRGGMTPLDRPILTGLGSREESLRGLSIFLDSRIGEFGMDVVAVSLQESASGATVEESASDWIEVSRLEV